MAAFVNIPAQVMPGYGSPSCNGQALAPLFTATPTTITIPATGATTPATGGTAFNPSGMPAPSKGKMRFRTQTVSAAVTTSVVFTVTDGTTTEQVHALSTAAGIAADYTFEFETDLSITSVSAIVTLGGTVGTGVAATLACSLV